MARTAVFSKSLLPRRRRLLHAWCAPISLDLISRNARQPDRGGCDPLYSRVSRAREYSSSVAVASFLAQHTVHVGDFADELENIAISPDTNNVSRATLYNLPQADGLYF